MEINIKNISSIKDSSIVIYPDEFQLIQTRAEARTLYAAISSLAKPDQKIDAELLKYMNNISCTTSLPEFITREDIHNAIIQRNFENIFYGQINSLYDNSDGKIEVINNDVITKFSIKSNIVRVENIKALNKNIIYIRDYNPYDSNIIDYMCNEGSVVDVLLNQESFGDLFRKAGVDTMELCYKSSNQKFTVMMPGLKEPLHIKNLTNDKLPFLILKQLVYHNSDILLNCILIVEQPNLSNKRLNLYKQMLQLIQNKFGTSIIYYN